ncbi:hypothetical protein ES703_118588 [subsurface metagenome]
MLHCFRQFISVFSYSYPDSATSAAGFDNHRIADVIRRFNSLGHFTGTSYSIVSTGGNRDTICFHQLARPVLGLSPLHGLTGGTDKFNAALFTGFNKAGILG